jgi:hypothetical protein
MIVSTIFINIAMILFASVAFAEPMSQSPCDLALLPEPVQKFLAKKYPGWRAWSFPQEDLDYSPDYLEDWIKNHAKDCPGVAIGHFEAQSYLSYAIMLAPSAPERSGYRFLVVSNEHGTLRETIIWEGNESADKVVYGYAYRVPPGNYQDFAKTKSIRLTSDGLVFRLIIGKQTILFYWKNGRFHELTIGE